MIWTGRGSPYTFRDVCVARGVLAVADDGANATAPFDASNTASTGERRLDDTMVM